MFGRNEIKGTRTEVLGELKWSAWVWRGRSEHRRNQTLFNSGTPRHHLKWSCSESWDPRHRDSCSRVQNSGCFRKVSTFTCGQGPPRSHPHGIKCSLGEASSASQVLRVYLLSYTHYGQWLVCIIQPLGICKLFLVFFFLSFRLHRLTRMSYP